MWAHFGISFQRSPTLPHKPVNLPFIPGLDASGIVDEVGSGVTRIKVGDRVVANAYNGTYAEYACFPEENVANIPTNIDFHSAAAASIGLITAHTFLIERGEIKARSRILILGAAGGTGTIVIQMARALGAYVIAVDSGDGIKLAKSLGADQALDYREIDFTEVVSEIDLVIDFVGGDTQSKAFKIIKAGGKLLSAFSVPSIGLADEYNVEAAFVIANLYYENLQFGLKMMLEDKIKPIIREIMQLEEAANAQDQLSRGGLNGKIILEINS